MANKNVSDIRKFDYNLIFDKIISKLDDFNLQDKNYYNMEDFESYFFKILTESDNYKIYKEITYYLTLIINKDYKKLIYCFIKNMYKFPISIYIILNESLSKEEMITKIIICDTFFKIYQISSIMKTDLYSTIKKTRIVRNIPIIDKISGKKIITRQVDFPMVGSEVCPFINYVKKVNVKNNILKYSILLIEKDIVIESFQYKCEDHISCVLYKNKKGKIDHLEKYDFWIDNIYWKRLYPYEKEYIN